MINEDFALEIDTKFARIGTRVLVSCTGDLFQSQLVRFQLNQIQVKPDLKKKKVHALSLTVDLSLRPAL